MLTMWYALFILVLAAITLVAISLQKTYNHIPLKELKRRAVKGDEVAQLLHRAASFGVSLSILLWIFIGLSAGGFFVLISLSLPSWLALSGAVALVWLGFAWLPNTKVSKLSQTIARYLTPAIAWLLTRIAPLTNRLVAFAKTNGRISVHTGLYQKEDLLELLDEQNKQLDNRISEDELKLARSALLFDDTLVRDCMTPRRVVKQVSDSETIGPLFLDDLHKSGFSRFPVFHDKPDNIVGTLYLKNLIKKETKGKVADAMSKQVYYVNEQQTLTHVLNAFIKTKHHLFMVVNSFEEVSGVVTIEDVIEQLIGRKIVDEFDKYDDMREVAKLAAKKDKNSHKHAVPETVQAETAVTETPKNSTSD